MRRRRERFAARDCARGLDVDVPAKPREAARASDVIVTCTSSHAPFLGPADVRSGTFIAAIGADNPDKSEIDPALMARARVVTDLTEQCSHMGDLHHAIAAGTMRIADVHAELGELVAGRKRGRTQAHEITLFDGSGVGIQDVAASARAYRAGAQAQCRPPHQPRVSFATQFEHREKHENQKVAFVCLHGSAKSLIAAEYFNRLAREKSLAADAPRPPARNRMRKSRRMSWRACGRAASMCTPTGRP